MDFANCKTMSSVPYGAVKTTSRFSSLAWSAMTTKSADFPTGLIAGGMVDGNIHVFDPSKLAADDPEPLLISAQQHAGAIRGLQFNPHKEWSHSLASGGSDGEVFVMSLERPDAPVSFAGPDSAKHTAEITKVAWNTGAAHVLATAATNGSTYVWDMKQRKAWCEIRDPTGGTISDIAWNPDAGLHLVTASGDDRNPVLKLWDLRSSTSLPLATLTGHTEGILSISWCPSDPSLLLSCGKDNRTMLWDLFHLAPVYDLPSGGGGGQSEEQPSQTQNVFGGLASSAGQKRYHVSWSPCLPAVVSACSFDRRVQFYSLSGARSRIGRAPRWLRKPVGATFGFGGKLVTFDNQNAPAAPGAAKSGTMRIKVSQVVEDVELVTACDAFHGAIASGDYKSFCENRSTSSEKLKDRQVWGLMKVICFESNAREQLQSHLGFDSASIAAAAQAYVSQNRHGDLKPQEAAADLSTVAASAGGGGGGGIGLGGGGLAGGLGVTDGATADDIFGRDLAPPPAPAASEVEGSTIQSKPSSASVHTKAAPLSAAAAAATAEMVATALASEAAEPTIRQAIVVGNFAAAVDCCLEAGLMAEALLLAQCGDQPLWLKTQAIFFERQKHRHAFLTILHAIIKSELMDFVLHSDLSKWRESLAVLSTYGKSDEFPAMCEALANRLETELGDSDSATLCYMCAANVARTVGFWTKELHAANAASGHLNTKALQQYVEKVVVFTHAHPVADLGPECSNFFAEYAGLLASQGRLDVASRYLKGTQLAETILIDRLYHAGNKPPGSRPPPFPFTKVTVSAVVARPAVAAAASATATTLQQQQHQAAAATSAHKPAAVHGHAAPAPAQQSTLPPGWVQVIDPASQRPYYVNQAQNITQWEMPAMVWLCIFIHTCTHTLTNTNTHSHAHIFICILTNTHTQQVIESPKHAQHTHTHTQAHTQSLGGGVGGIGGGMAGMHIGGQQQQQHQQFGQLQQQTQHVQQQHQHQQYQQQQQHQPQQQQIHHQQQPLSHAPHMMQQAPQMQQQQPHMMPQTHSHTHTHTHTHAHMGSMGGPTSFGGGGMPQQQQQQMPQQQLMPPASSTGAPRLGGGVGGGAGFGGAAPAMSAPAPVAAAPAAAPRPVAAASSGPAVSSEAVVALGQIIDAISAAASAAEKRQLPMIQSAYQVLVKMAEGNEVSADVMAKIGQLVNDLSSRNFNGATAVQTDLANTVWAQHNGWIKGMKILIQLASKKQF